MGDEGKAVGSAQAPAALLSPNHTRTALFAGRFGRDARKAIKDFAMSAMGHKRTFGGGLLMSALPPKADIA
jgi:hypothetical protein